MTQVHLLCGKTASGKTTFARQLEQSRKAVRFTIDQWMIRLFGHRIPLAVFPENLGRCKEIALALTERLLALEVQCVLDFGFQTRAERDAIRGRLGKGGVECLLYYFEAPDAVLLERLRARNTCLSHDSYPISAEAFAAFSRQFEPPQADETCIRVAPWTR